MGYKKSNYLKESLKQNWNWMGVPNKPSVVLFKALRVLDVSCNIFFLLVIYFLLTETVAFTDILYPSFPCQKINKDKTWNTAYSSFWVSIVLTRCTSSLLFPNKTGDNKFLEKSEKRKLLESWLNKIMRVKISDGRTLIGSFLCTDQDRNIILGSCQEFVGSSGVCS